MLVSIVDYDTGNLESVVRSVLFAAKNIKKKITIKISKSPDVIFKSDKIILPGQGSYKKCADSIRRVNGLWSSLDSFAKYSGKYILGICVGMQLFSDYGFEEKITKGFGWIPGQVKKIKTKNRLIKLPHIGWNEINFKKKHLVFSGIKNLSHFYFVHSYEFKLKNKKNLLCSTNYGYEFASAVVKDNILGVQFHPEKSQDNGLRFLSNFLSL